jgi:hypothetical protein
MVHPECGLPQTLNSEVSASPAFLISARARRPPDGRLPRPVPMLSIGMLSIGVAGINPLVIADGDLRLAVPL